VERKLGFILDTPTWRASADWGEKLGISREVLADVNRASVDFAKELATSFQNDDTPIVVNGVVGPRGDGYRVGTQMSAAEAQGYHSDQIKAFRDAGADMVSAITMTYAEEAIGITRVSQASGLPVVVAFTVETDGRLPSGQTLRSAIETVDAETDTAPAYYMINCAHPSHFESVLSEGAWLDRIRGLRANASRQSHAELDEATELDPGDPLELAQHYRALRNGWKRLSVFGGCCGTDHRHIAAICDACLT
jgi:homocysteine S-methyltransferase